MAVDVFQVNIMAHDSGAQHQFTGIAKYFNSYTITGRRNVSHELQLFHTPSGHVLLQGAAQGAQQVPQT